jgi:hypothetical protein
MNAKLELIKWVAFVLMLGDHINAAWFGRDLPLLSEVARIVFPLFAFVMAYRLGRDDAVESGAAQRVFKRLLLWGLVAQPFHAAAFGYALPLNVLLTFAVAVAVISNIQRGRWLRAVVVFALLSPFVDYPIAGPALVVAVWACVRQVEQAEVAQAWVAGIGVGVALLAVCFLNQSAWALFAVPVGALLLRARWEAPRLGRAFYVAYPAHLALLAGLASWGAGVPPADTLVMPAHVPVDGNAATAVAGEP